MAGMLLFAVPAVNAQMSTSPNFQLDETAIGTSGLLDAASPNFRISEATGDLGVGESASANYRVLSGTHTSPDPVLAFSVDEFDAEFNTFSATEASTATAKFSVKNYTAWGYVVQIYGPAPTNGPHTLPAIDDTPTQSHVGLEQFGINLVANTAPTSVGANPDNGEFGVGTAESNYNLSNRYYYNSGDIIASAPKESGETIYTISYLVNVAGRTPGGQYKSNQTIIVTGTY